MSYGIVMPMGEHRGGVESMLLRLLRANNAGPRTDYSIAFLEDGAMVEEVRKMGYRTHVFPAGRLRQPVQFMRTVLALKRWLREERIETVLSWQAKAHLYTGLAARGARIPSAWFVHSIPDRYWLDRLINMVPAAAVFCCGETARQAQARMRPARPTRTVYIAVDLDRFNPDNLPAPREAREALGLPVEGELVGMVARLQRWKGVHDFVDAAAKVAAQRPETRFYVIGGEHFSEPEYLNELKKQARSLGIEDRVVFAGHQSDIPLWMQAMDILIHASYNEPTGTVLLEAMALGKPLIGARTEGPMEFVSDHCNGLLASPGHPDELAAAILELARDPELCRRLGNAARLRAREFSAERLAATTAACLQQVAQG